ncbi:type II toxin-antitoxin system VapC family toxin [Candidatus Fermentibacteria bacterium]|nr:type II toxin-antitoxin system VapC family toxin [Candidatus Fermentibacteria bacterium]
MITAVDTNVLLDVFLDDPCFGMSSAALLRRCIGEGVVAVGEVVWAECAAAFPNDEDFRTAMAALGVNFVATSADAALRAGRAWRQYRSRGGSRQRMVADFLIGAHALVQTDRLLSRDRGFYATYFHDLTVLDPSHQVRPTPSS